MNSWLFIEKEDPSYALPDDLRRQDANAAVDCGWIEQMIPFIEQFTKPGDCVLDPFAGFASTLVACGITNRRGIGCELDLNRLKISRERLERLAQEFKMEQIIKYGDAGTFDWGKNSIDLCLTNVPYFGFSDWVGDGLEGHLYNEDNYCTYLQKVKDVFRNVARSLKPDAYVVCMCENILSNSGQVIPLAWDIGRVISEVFELKQEVVICYPHREEPPAACYQTDRSHEYALVGRNTRSVLNWKVVKEILTDLQKQKICFAVIGSVGRRLLGFQITDEPADCDIVIDPEQIVDVIKLLEQKGFDLYSWSERITPEFDLSRLAGRSYLRAIRARDEVIDITYECNSLDFEQALNNAVEIDAVPVAAEETMNLLDTLKLEEDGNIFR